MLKYTGESSIPFDETIITIVFCTIIMTSLILLCFILKVICNEVSTSVSIKYLDACENTQGNWENVHTSSVATEWNIN